MMRIRGSAQRGLYSKPLALVEGCGGGFVLPTRLDDSADVDPQSEHPLHLLGGITRSGH